jgi:methionyl-tRNA formyltransferase
VKRRALELGIEVLQPTQLKSPDFAAELRGLDVEVAVVAAYGRILPKGLLDAPRRGCVNVHASLLPRWRGAAPIQWAIIEGDTETGVCLMEMDEGLDTGPVFAHAVTTVGPDETAVELAQRLSVMGAALLREALPRWLAGELRAVPQDSTRATVARRLLKEDGDLDFAEPAKRVHDRVRGLQPWPGASAVLNDPGHDPVRVKIHRTRLLDETGVHGQPGAIVGASPDGIEVACGSGKLAILELQVEGKRKLATGPWLAGRRLSRQARFAREMGDQP